MHIFINTKRTENTKKANSIDHGLELTLIKYLYQMPNIAITSTNLTGLPNLLRKKEISDWLASKILLYTIDIPKMKEMDSEEVEPGK